LPPELQALQTQFAELSETQRREILALGTELGDNVLAVQYYLLADKNLDQARALAS
jgi:hypothetical protein